MNKKDIIVLIYTKKSSDVKVISIEEAEKINGFDIDIKEDIWTNRNNSPTKIGYADANNVAQKTGVIGVYNRTRIKDINSIITHAKWAIK